jgi:hypothetical protein
MKLIDTLLLALAVVFIIIGIYEIIQFGIGTGYWSVMVAILLFFYYHYRKGTKKA